MLRPVVLYSKFDPKRLKKSHKKCVNLTANGAKFGDGY